MNRLYTNSIYIVRIALCALVIITTGCASKKRVKKTVETTPVVVEEAAPVYRWKTCLVSGGYATIRLGDQKLSSDCRMEIVRDSMVVISVTPLLGIEALRVEATPDSVWIIDKLNRRYSSTDYQTINRYLTPKVTYVDLENMASGEDLTDDQNELQYTYSAWKKTATLQIRYNTIRRDIPLRINTLNKARYTYIDPKELLAQ